jgi:hypothetical protein
MINHPEARETLLQMAREGEADMKRLRDEQEHASSGSEPTPSIGAEPPAE